MQTITRRRFLKYSTNGVAAIGLGLSSLHAQDWARNMVDKSPRKREWVTVKHGGRAVESTVAYPQSKGKSPAMVVIHEIFGMTDWVENVTDEFAEAGFISIAPDLLSGMAPKGGRTKDFPAAEGGGGFGPAAQAIMKLPPDQVTADLNAVVDYCKSLPSCNGKVCVVGFSWGGSQCFRFATNRKDLSAVFPFYGSGPESGISNIQAPVYGFYGGTDTRINGSIPQTQEQMKAAGKFYEPVIYDGAAHGFMRTGEQPGATEADKKARDAAWAKIKSLMPKFK